ncbi:MAG TPA: glycosyltransferase [Thermoanaerobaculia bacterium]|nr:glycosyltransferase [Thermoanaerobaculia bacterium]
MLQPFRRPIDWRRGAGRPKAEPPRTVDVIIPVYGAPGALTECLASVAAQTDSTRHNVRIVVDGPQNDAVEAVLARHPFPLLRNERRLGFTRSANRGMRVAAGDVVLLNSDAVVTARWLEKLIEAAYANGDTGTVTPLSNDATLCSVPRGFERNLIPSGYDAGSFGALVERVSQRSYPAIPTGVGFCLYIRRALLDDIGFFDEERFGGGYGEENDFCMRALARGWVNVADDATFVYHRGHQSFGATRESRQAAATQALERVHPRYMPTIAEFMKHDSLEPVRARIRNALDVGRASARPGGLKPALRIAHVVHGWPPFQHAGTELYAYWLVMRQRECHHVVVYARSAETLLDDGEAAEWVDGGVRVRLVANHFTARDPFRRNGIRNRPLEHDFERFLREEKPDLVHIHHLAGHAMSLAGVARRLGIPTVMQIQDWFFVCARVNQYDRNGKRCSGPAIGKCARCADLTSIHPSGITNRLMHVLRRRAAKRALATADAFIAGSKAVRDDYAGSVPRSTPFHVIPYGVAISQSSERRGPVRKPLRFGYVGSISPHKGVHLAVEAMRGIDPSDATLHIWGDASAYPDYTSRLQHPVEGRFDEEEKERVFSAIDILLVPSIGLESFGLAPREAMARGVPVIASEGGALSEMPCGEFFPAGDVAALRAIIRRIVAEPSLVDRWAAELPRPKSADEHAEEIEQVYRSVLRR